MKLNFASPIHHQRIYSWEQAICWRALVRTFPSADLLNHSRQKIRGIVYRRICDEELERREVRNRLFTKNVYEILPKSLTPTPISCDT